LELAQGDITDPCPGIKDHWYFDTPDLKYVGYCDDFGPMNASSVLAFAELHLSMSFGSKHLSNDFQIDLQ
jgi:hypothetical protein